MMFMNSTKAPPAEPSHRSSRHESVPSISFAEKASGFTSAAAGFETAFPFPRFSLSPLLFLLLLLALPAHAIIFPLTWRWSNPTPHGATIVDMAYANGLVIQVGERGQIFTSTDLDQWIPRNSHTTRSLRGVTFFGGRILVTGESGTILFADDPSAFFLVDLSTPDWLESVAASTNLAVAVGDNAAIYTSTNGVVWQRQTAGFTNWLRGVAYGAGQFVAVGERGRIATSPNGAAWTTRTSGLTNHLNRVAWFDTAFYAVADGGKLLTSPTGTTWTLVNTGATNSLYAAPAGTNSQVVAGDLEVRLRESGSWSNQLAAALPLPPPAWTYFAGLWNGAEYLLAGRSGMLVEGYKTNATTPLIWPTHSNPIRHWLWAVARFPGYYAAVGDRGTILTSPNGIDWDLELVPNTATNTVFLGVGGSTNLYLAVGTAGAILWSTNLLIWTEVTPRPTTNDLQGVAYAEGKFIVSGGRGVILTSTNGTNWTSRTSGTTAFLSCITPFPGGFVATGDGGTILTSTNGINWNARTSGTTNWLYHAQYVGGLMLAVGENGAILTTSNAVNWTARASGTTRWLNNVQAVDDTLFVVGNQGTVLASANAVTWTNIGTITRKSLYGLAANGTGQIVVVGSEGAIIRSQALPATTPVHIREYTRTAGNNLFLFTGQPDQRFLLQDTTTLTNWLEGPPLEFLDSTGTLLYFETAKPDAPPRRYYRANLAR